MLRWMVKKNMQMVKLLLCQIVTVHPLVVPSVFLVDIFLSITTCSTQLQDLHRLSHTLTLILDHLILIKGGAARKQDLKEFCVTTKLFRVLQPL